MLSRFEQFCINLTNEKLQQHFNQHVFKMEQEEYTKENIDWSYIEFEDNQDVLDLIEKKPGGIIALLDEACMFPRSTHKTFAEKLYQTFRNHKRFKKPKLSQTDFTIRHYAGDVTYRSDFFLDKNKDYVIGEHHSLLNASRDPFVSALFPPLPELSSNKSKFSSIGTRFKQQLQSLLETLNATEPHYVRCIKPNNLLKPGIFENKNVLQQLQSGGVMEAIRISSAGFPTRKTFDEFISRFKLLAPDILSGRYDEVTACKKLLEKVGLKGYQIGKTKLFLRGGQMAELDAHLTELLGKSATNIQKKYRSYYAHKIFMRLRISSIQIQALCRRQVARQRYETTKRLHQSAIHIQAGMRGMSARHELRIRKQPKAAIGIQAAKKTGRPQAAKSLEQEVEELTEQLQLEKRMREDETRENAKLKSDLEKMRLQGGTRVDHDLISKLTAENEELKSQVNSLENRIIQLKIDMQRLEEKLSDIEMEGQVLRQQTLPTTPPPPTEQENVDDLLLAVTKNVGFSQNKPVAAITIFRCLMQWKSFEADRTSVFDRVIQMIGSSIENEADEQHMVYYLSNTSTLLFLLQRTYKPKPAQPTGFFGRLSQGFVSSSSSLDGWQQVEPKYPALLFKQQLTAYVEKLYRIVRDNLKKKLSPSLDSFTKPGSPPPDISSPDSPWNRMVDCLKDSLNTLKDNYVHPVLVQKIFTKTFSYINVQIFNSLLLHQEFCTFRNGEFSKAGIDELENWCSWAVLYAGSSWDELNHLRQAVDFLVMKDKSKLTYSDLTNDLCPALSVQQLHRICTLFNSKSNDPTASLSTDVFSSMKEVMTTGDSEDSDSDVNSILLDDNSSIPVTVDEISDSIKADGFSKVEPPSELLKKEAFQFLRE